MSSPGPGWPLVGMKKHLLVVWNLFQCWNYSATRHQDALPPAHPAPSRLVVMIVPDSHPCLGSAISPPRVYFRRR